MKKVIAILLFFLPSLVLGEYEPRLKTFSIEEGTKIVFSLDNGWVFIGESALESKLYALRKLLDMRVRVDTYPQCPYLELSLENPEHRGCDRISFPGFVTKETYDSLLTVTNVEIEDGFFFQSAYITLSDGSRWYAKTNLGVLIVATYWARGDRVIVTRNYTTETHYVLVNLDVSGNAYVDYYIDRHEHYYSMRDPRSVTVIRAPRNSSQQNCDF